MKQPYAVCIEEISRRTVVVWAEDAEEAESVADDLCSNDEIILDYDDFMERSCRSLRTATESDLVLRAQYNKEEVQDEKDI